MKAPLANTVFTATIALVIALFTACSSESETSKKKENKASEENVIPKSEKGNWIESDAKKFLADVESSMASFRDAVGEEIAQKIAICYLDKAILTFDNYEQASKNPDKCNELATECVNELGNPDDSEFEEVAEENISKEKLQEVTGNLDEMLKDQLPPK